MTGIPWLLKYTLQNPLQSKLIFNTENKLHKSVTSQPRSLWFSTTHDCWRLCKLKHPVSVDQITVYLKYEAVRVYASVSKSQSLPTTVGLSATSLLTILPWCWHEYNPICYCMWSQRTCKKLNIFEQWLKSFQQRLRYLQFFSSQF